MFRRRAWLIGVALVLGLSGCGYDCCSHPWFSGWFDRFSFRPAYYEPIPCCAPCPSCPSCNGCGSVMGGSGVVANAPILGTPNGAVPGPVMAAPSGTPAPGVAERPPTAQQQQYAKPAPYVPTR
ncbi:MAG: hypothetical protein NZM31_02900 [Gemmatales bacterium]|nr:hypothetical protein [Gemmatales bacterium]MDW8385949.1 hypothetical protein [Gemmatales bacterium]